MIDGQQRLTTLSLLLAAVFSVFKANKSSDDDDETIADRLVLQKPPTRQVSGVGTSIKGWIRGDSNP
ncbi:hypothetical protein QT381_01650 [Galbitalea sp. SE-J8]|uniref:hypothetical protein n=1 Tax=Galbitalea sp. SE-J8 TaxID=3054952 RepID=UPI00259CDCDE|nr:hypothetical protein [Galbitalea sp. SE-J8]MDM4761708.1 hypothetical protein [Galbitalea sp. SE-J8]